MGTQLSTEQCQELDHIFASVNKERLQGWDLSFFTDQHARYEDYGAKTFISPKQWMHLRRIYQENTDPVPEGKPKGRRTVGENYEPRGDLDDEVPF